MTGGALSFQGERILALGAPIPGARELHLPGKLICPMFVDAHTHVGDTGAKELGIGLPHAQVVIPPDGLKHRFLRSLDTDTLVSMMRTGLLDMLQSGVVACADFREQGLAGVRALRRAAAGLPIHAVALGRMDEAADPATLAAEAHALLQEADGLGVRDVESYPSAVIGALAQRVSRQTVCGPRRRNQQRTAGLPPAHRSHAGGPRAGLAARSARAPGPRDG